MARPKAGTKEGDAASKKWRQTMINKYGVDGVHKKMQSIGKIGGKNGFGPGYTGGFAADPERARIVGAKGGSISKRKSKYINIFEYNRDEIIGAINGARTLTSLAKEIKVPYSALLHYVNAHIRNQE